MKTLQTLTMAVLMCFASLAAQAQCSATFSSSNSPASQGVVSFTSTLTGFQLNMTTYSWTFYDLNGGVLGYSYTSNPTYTYPTNGIYVACLTVTDSICTSTYCDSVMVSGMSGNPCAGVNAFFTSTSSGANVSYLQASLSGSPYSNDPYEYTWTIGGATYTGKNIYYQAAAGAYVACLSVVDTFGGCTVTTYCDSVLVSGNTSNPCAGFTTDFSFSVNPILPTSGQLSSTVTGGTAPYTYVWTVGNNTITTANPSLQLPGNGAYSVCLAVYDANGCIATKCDSILISNTGNNPCTGLSASFTYTDDSLGTNSGYFTSAVTGGTAPYTYSWTINGSSSTAANPYWQFNGAGTYNICLTVTDANGCATTTCNTVVVGGGNPCGNISVSYTISQNRTNPFVLYLQPIITGLNMNPANSGLDFIWTWGDNTGTVGGAMPSHQYGNTGSYVVCLTVIDSIQGCAYTFCDSVNLDSLGNFSRNAGGFIINTIAAQYNTITGIEENVLDIQSTMVLFPNPVHSTLNININSLTEENAQLAVFDLNGKQLINKVVNVAEGDQQLSLPVNNLPAGMYIIRMQGEQLQHTDKFIKQ